jgi:hypothetical protein
LAAPPAAEPPAPARALQVTAEGGWQIPPPRPATFMEWLTEYSDASKGAQPPIPLTGARIVGCWVPTTVCAEPADPPPHTHTMILHVTTGDSA